MLKHMLKQTVTIASGASTSSETESLGLMLVGIEMPASFTGTELAIYAGHTSGATVAAYEDTGGAITAQVGASRYVDMAWAKLVAKYLRVVSNGTEEADRTVTLVFGEA